MSATDRITHLLGGVIADEDVVRLQVPVQEPGLVHRFLRTAAKMVTHERERETGGETEVVCVCMREKASEGG